MLATAVYSTLYALTLAVLYTHAIIYGPNPNPNPHPNPNPNPNPDPNQDPYAPEALNKLIDASHEERGTTLTLADGTTLTFAVLRLGFGDP